MNRSNLKFVRAAKLRITFLFLLSLFICFSKIWAGEWSAYASISDGAENGVSYSQKVHQYLVNDPKGKEVFWKLKSTYTSPVTIEITFTTEAGTKETCSTTLKPGEEKENGGWWTTSKIVSATATFKSETPAPASRNGQPIKFTWNYQGDPDPGTRTWTRHDTTWSERYASGRGKSLKFKSRTTVNGFSGTIVEAVGDEDLNIFIPDLNSKSRSLLFRRGADAWSVLATIDTMQ